jgi:hypothetical protein
MSELLRLPESAERVAQHLILAANAAGGPDNVSAVIVDCSTGPDTALPLGPTEPPPPPDSDMENDPELLILGSEEIDLDDHSNMFVNALTEAFGRK